MSDGLVIFMREKIKSLEWLKKTSGSDNDVVTMMEEAANYIEKLEDLLDKILIDCEYYDFSHKRFCGKDQCVCKNIILAVGEDDD